MSISRVRNIMQSAMGISMEDESAVTINVNVNPEDDAAEQADKEAVDQASTDIDQAADESEDSDDAVTQLDDTSANLEAIAISLEAAIQDGGLNAQAITFAQLAINAQTKDLNMESVSVSLESVSTASSRLRYSQELLEGVKEKIGKIWEAIKRAIATAWAKIKEFFSKLMGGWAALSKRATAVGEKAKALKSEKSADVKISNARALSFKGKVSADLLVEHMDKSDENMVRVAKKIEASKAAAAKKVLSMAGDTNHAEFVGDFLKALRAPRSKAKSPVLGGSIVESGKDDTLSFAFEKEAAVEDSQEVKALTKAQIQTICKNIVACAKAADKIKEASAKLDEDHQKLIETVGKIVEKAGSSVDAKTKKAARDWMAVAPKFASGSNLTAIAAILYQTSRAALSYCEKSLSAIAA